MKQAADEVTSEGEADGFRVPLLGAASYKIAPDTDWKDLADDAQVFIQYSLEMIENIAEQLCDQKSQLTANTRSASTLLYGATQLMRIAEAAICAAASRRN